MMGVTYSSEMTYLERQSSLLPSPVKKFWCFKIQSYTSMKRGTTTDGHTTRARTCAETYIPKGCLIGFRTCVNLLECIILCPRISNPNFQLNVYNYTLLKCSPYLPFTVWSSFVTPQSALPSITSPFHRQCLYVSHTIIRANNGFFLKPSVA
jgi:hypothetical protein